VRQAALLDWTIETGFRAGRGMVVYSFTDEWYRKALVEDRSPLTNRERRRRPRSARFRPPSASPRPHHDSTLVSIVASYNGAHD
jgi:hypothetical protein